MKILCVSLGCDKNLVDTEMMLGLLNRDGYTLQTMKMRRMLSSSIPAALSTTPRRKA